MTYRCLIYTESFDTPQKLELHLQIRHKWGQKRQEPTGLDAWTE